MSREVEATVQVWDVDSGQVRSVSRSEAAAGLLRYARAMPVGSPARGQTERQAAEIAKGSRSQ